jgi:hypothetical protein
VSFATNHVLLFTVLPEQVSYGLQVLPDIAAGCLPVIPLSLKMTVRVINI